MYVLTASQTVTPEDWHTDSWVWNQLVFIVSKSYLIKVMEYSGYNLTAKCFPDIIIIKWMVDCHVLQFRDYIKPLIDQSRERKKKSLFIHHYIKYNFADDKPETLRTI